MAVTGVSWAQTPPAASEPAGFKDVLLSVYPEYDDPFRLGYPSLLVMLDGQIEGATPPTTIRFLVTKDAVMYSAGSGPRERYVGGPPNRKASDMDGWDEISFELKTNYFVVEYYTAIPSSPNRSFSALFIPLYPIDGLTVLVQEPRQATNFGVVPQSQPVGQQQYTDDQGFNIRRYSYNKFESRQQLGFSLSYTKNNPAPSLEIKGSSNTGLIIAIVVIAAIGIGGLMLYLALRRPSYGSRQTRRRALLKAQAKKSTAPRFCPKCGSPLDDSQNFCDQCGTRLRGK